MDIKIRDSNFAHCEYTNNKTSKFDVKWNRIFNSNNIGDDDFVIYTDHQLYMVDTDVNVKNKIAWLVEPPSISPHFYYWIRKNNKKFKYVLTFDDSLLSKGENYIYLPFGGCWINSEDQKIHEKTKLTSIISSAKKMTYGHNLRHIIINKYKDSLDVYGGGYNFIENKIIGLKDYRFSITIENIKKDFYITEKLIDCFVTGTVPIYWGCPKLDKFFDMEGIIMFDDLKDIDNIINNLSIETYNKMLTSIKNNFELAKSFFLAEDYMIEQDYIKKYFLI